MNRSILKRTVTILLFILFYDTAEGLRILGLFPFPSRSHSNMCVGLMRGLAERGHHVDVYSHFPLKKPVANYTDFSLAGSMPILSNSMTFENITSFDGNSISIPGLLQISGNCICKLMDLPIFQKLLRQPPNDPPYDLVVVEPFLANCYLAWGRHLKVPMIMVVTTGGLLDWLHEPLGNPTNTAVEPSIFSRSTSPMDFYERVSNVLLDTYIKWSFNYHAHEQDAMVKKHFGPNMPNVIELQNDVALTFVNSHHALNGLRSHSPAVIPVAGIHISDNSDPLSKEVQTFLDDSQSGFIYFSFGSMVLIESFPKPMLEALHQAFELIAPVRVLMKIAKPEELPRSLPSNVMTQPWLNQVAVLKHKNIRAFVTHGGLMSTQESIYHGVPIIGIPLFGDQYFNIESYARRNMAIKVLYKEITGQGFAKAVNEIINNPIYKQSVNKVGAKFRDTPLGPKETAVFWIEYIARHGKDALRLPVMDMPWWQAKLYDVYGFFFFIVAATLYAIKIVYKMLFVSKKDQKQKIQ